MDSPVVRMLLLCITKVALSVVHSLQYQKLAYYVARLTRVRITNSIRYPGSKLESGTFQRDLQGMNGTRGGHPFPTLSFRAYLYSM